jgi:hypothetical protein
MTEEGYRVLVDDNFHFMDEDERYGVGVFESYAEAVAKCERIVEDCLRVQLQPGMTADELYRMYMMFGEDPWIAGKPEGPSSFSAWDFARTRTREICCATGVDTASSRAALDEIKG